MPAHLQWRLTEDANADVRLVANPGPGEAAQVAVLALREQAIGPTLDKMYGRQSRTPWLTGSSA